MKVVTMNNVVSEVKELNKEVELYGYAERDYIYPTSTEINRIKGAFIKAGFIVKKLIIDGVIKMKSIVNLTPHTLRLVTEFNTLTVIDPSGTVARVDVVSVPNGSINNIKVYKNSYGAVTDLPDPVPNTIYVVSALVAQACKDRPDVFYPDKLIRDNQGRVDGAKGLAQY